VKRPPARRLLVVVALLAGLVLARAPPAAGQDEPLATATGGVAQMLAAGRTLDVTAALVSGFATLPPAEHESWFFFAAMTCLSLESTDCAAAVLGLPLVLEFTPERVYPQTAGALILLTAWSGAVIGEDRDARRLAETGIPKALATPLSRPVLYAEFALLAAQQARRANNFALSRSYLDRALATTLSFQDERHAATGLVLRIIRQHVANYDAERALRLFVAAETLFETVPRASLQYVQLLRLRAELNGYRGDPRAASQDLLRLVDRLDDLQLEPGVRETMRADAYSQLIVLETLAGERDVARAFLLLHPLAERRAGIHARGRFADATEFWFAVTEEFILGDGARLGTDGWRALLEQPIDWTTHDDDREQAEAFARLAASVNRLRRGEPGARASLLEAAHRRLATLQRLHRQSVFASPLPSWPDRLLLEIAATATIAAPSPDLGLLLGVHVVLARSLHSRSDDTLAALARYRTDAGRRAVQGLYVTDLQRIDWETAALEALGRRLLGPPGTAADRAAIVSAAGDFTRRQASLRAALVTPPGGQPEGERVGIRALQHRLQPDEALLFYVPMLDGQLAKVCLRRDRAMARSEPMDNEDFAQARRLVAALLSDEPPSPDDDRRFPVAAAVRLHRILLGDLEPCLDGARRVHHVPPRGLERLPPGILLAEPPPLLGDRHDLRAAHWRVRDLAFVQETSISAFLAARRLAGTRTARLDYLGVGDPVLAAPVIGSALPELPEASQELQAVAGLFPADRARVLRRADATEQRLGEAPAGDYDILHFATHGLTRHDLPDLAEPGLVLTAAAGSDGFLPASRIATWPLRARLVVLSACNSARHDPLLGDRGIQGLATAFTLAGVPSTIAALWPVDSALARDTIVATFAAARGGGSGGGVAIADALALAQRRHLDGPTPRPLLHPRFWAALVVMGDGAMTLAAATP